MNAVSSFELVDDAPSEWRLCELLEGWATVEPAHDVRLGGIVLDSRKIVPDSLFVALAGGKSHGLDYLQQVIVDGAAAVVFDPAECSSEQSKLLQGCEIASVPVAKLRSFAGAIASRYYGHPSHAIKVIGITGTDGKTSVCELLVQALSEVGNCCASIGTLGARVGNQSMDFGLTTPDPVQLQLILRDFLRRGVDVVAMEVSSHALDQHRVGGVDFDVAVLTNLGRDHLDYHGNLKSYRAAKTKLFTDWKQCVAVLNADDSLGAELADGRDDDDYYTYGAQKRVGQHVQISQIAANRDSLRFVLSGDDYRFAQSTALLGRFNVHNLAAVFTVLVALGSSAADASNMISKLQPVAGRVQKFRTMNGATVIVDYAHNAHALESLLTGIRDHVKGKIILIFGCGGDRDKGKRALMATVAEKHADISVVTDDNPRQEDGGQIVAQILSGFKNVENVQVVRDRRVAIQLGIELAEADDWLVVAGKGHENYQIIGDRKYPFSDAEVIEGLIRQCEVVS